MSEQICPSLDNLSSSQHSRLTATYRDYLIPKVKAEYAKAYEFYVGELFQQYDFVAKRFLECHSQAVFVRHNITGLVRVLAQSCHLRFCPICNRAKEKLIRHNVLDWIQHVRYPKLLTVTLKHSDDELKTQVSRLYECFRKLRRLKLIKKNVGAGIWFFQIKKSKNDSYWHPHLHCLITGHYVPQRELARKWQRITGESMIVDIRLIKDIAGAVNDVAKYCARSCSLLHMDLTDLTEVDKALKNRRICGTWGSARKHRLTQPLKYNQNDWSHIGSWSAVVGCYTTDESACQIFEAWSTGLPLADNIDVNYLDDFRKNSLPRNDVVLEYGGWL